jgi:polyferredoxin
MEETNSFIYGLETLVLAIHVILAIALLIMGLQSGSANFILSMLILAICVILIGFMAGAWMIPVYIIGGLIWYFNEQSKPGRR